MLFLSVSVLANWSKLQGNQPHTIAACLEDKDGASVWLKRAVSMIKINVDAAIFSAFGTFSVAGIAKDSDGVLIEAFSKCQIGQLAPELAEAIGIKEAIIWIKRKRWKSILLETDSLLVVQALRSPLCYAFYFGSIILDYLDILRILHFVDVIFVRRSANKAAHALACFSCSVADRSLLYSDLDSGTLSALREDCNYVF